MIARSVHSGRGTAAAIINAIGTIVAVILALHIIFGLTGANPANPVVTFIAQWAGAFALWFRDLFATGNATVDMIVNYGIAAVFWLFVTGLLARLVRRVG
ncbi:hypothetical protein [Gandjariella thermophila]|uniref:Uncharacterized protein n=1 Tax=Gandjariella thermophila TaxID=1931992 RepID=A0A4D4J6M2_9PSEU|nr:hypothetical protein [Gandjariella thermophila]GDY30690.1 hypothetical protein GTS_23230 [Gandjariella thermophila]